MTEYIPLLKLCPMVLEIDPRLNQQSQSFLYVSAELS